MGVRLRFNDHEKVQKIVLGMLTISDVDELMEQIVNNFNPEDLFPQSELETWAEDNGWVKPR